MSNNKAIVSFLYLFVIISFYRGTGYSQENTAPNEYSSSKNKNKNVERILVTSHRRTVTEKIDRTVYDVRSGSDLSGSNTLDVLRLLPGISIGPSEDVTIRGGAHVSYLIDGKAARREVALAVPAGEIERVEVIPNPSEEYDSNSEALINLILKHNAKTGWWGTASLEGDSLGGIKNGVTMSRGGNRWDINSSLTTRSLSLRTSTYRTSTFVPTETNSAYYQQKIDTVDRKRTNKTSFQLKASQKAVDGNSLSLMIGTSVSIIPQKQNVTQETLLDNQISSLPLVRVLKFRGFYPYFNVSITRKINDHWSMDATFAGTLGYTSTIRKTFVSLAQYIRENTDFYDFEPNFSIKRTVGNGYVKFLNSYSSNPVKDNMLSGSNPLRSSDTEKLYDFNFNRGVFSSVLLYEGTFFGVGVKPALRFEDMSQSFANGSRKVNGLRDMKYILPSIHLSKKINDENAIKASYTERTDRPDALELNPYVNVISPFYVQVGNPFLKPTREKEYDLTYTYSRSAISFSNSLYFRDKVHDISKYLSSDNSGITTVTYKNLGSSKTYGYSGTLKATLLQGLQVGAGVDVYHTSISAPSDLKQTESVAFTSFNFNTSATLDLEKYGNLSTQLSYVGKSFDLSIETPRYFTSQIEYKYKFFKKLTAFLIFSDVIIPLDRRSHFTGSGVYGVELTRSNSRLARLGISTEF